MVLAGDDNDCVKYLNEFTRTILITRVFRYFCGDFYFTDETYKILSRSYWSICHLGIFQPGFKAFTRLSFPGYFVLQGFSLRRPDAGNQFRI